MRKLKEGIVHLEEVLQLHQSITIIYVVDGYAATLEQEDGYDSLDDLDLTGHGETIAQALVSLSVKVNKIKKQIEEKLR